MKIRKIRTTLTAITALMLVQVAQAGEARGTDKPMNCDSTCVSADSRTTPLPKAQLIKAPTTTAAPTPRPKCGASAGSVLPGAPSSFLCSTGTASSVTTVNANGETSYQWTCSNSLGTQACMADQREVGACGPDNGSLLASNPTNQCAAGEATGFNFNGSKYTWSCQGNYGSPAYCSATYDPPPPPSLDKTVQAFSRYPDTYEPASARELIEGRLYYQNVSVLATMSPYDATYGINPRVNLPGFFGWDMSNPMMCNTTYYTSDFRQINLELFGGYFHMRLSDFKDFQYVVHACRARAGGS